MKNGVSAVPSVAISTDAFRILPIPATGEA